LDMLACLLAFRFLPSPLKHDLKEAPLGFARG